MKCHYFEFIAHLQLQGTYPAYGAGFFADGVLTGTRHPGHSSLPSDIRAIIQCQNCFEGDPVYIVIDVRSISCLDHETYETMASVYKYVM